MLTNRALRFVAMPLSRRNSGTGTGGNTGLGLGLGLGVGALGFPPLSRATSKRLSLSSASSSDFGAYGLDPVFEDIDAEEEDVGASGAGGAGLGTVTVNDTGANEGDDDSKTPEK